MPMFMSIGLLIFIDHVILALFTFISHLVFFCGIKNIFVIYYFTFICGKLRDIIIGIFTYLCSIHIGK